MYADDDFENEEGDRDGSERHVESRDVLLEAREIHLRGRLWDDREEHKEEEVRHGLAQIAGPAERKTEWLREDPEAHEDIPDIIAAVMLLVAVATMMRTIWQRHERGAASVNASCHFDVIQPC